MRKSDFHEYSPGTVVRNGDRAYYVEDVISRGKLGYAFACRDDRGGFRTLQVLWPFSRSYENVREQWSQDAADLQRVRHPGLVSLLDGFEHQGCFHLVHERFAHRLDRQIASPDWDGERWLLAVARPLLGALAHLHQSGLTHKDLHPRNVLCAIDLQQAQPEAWPGRAFMLGDLAVNRLLGNVDVLNTKISRWLVPPEYLNPSECGPLDYRTDIYQAGLLLLCMLQGRIVPYSFEDISTGLPAQAAEELDSGFGQVLARALQPKVKERFQHAGDLWQALSSGSPCFPPCAAESLRCETSPRAVGTKDERGG
jgi:serine/threonine protein kinase